MADISVTMTVSQWVGAVQAISSIIDNALDEFLADLLAQSGITLEEVDDADTE